MSSDDYDDEEFEELDEWEYYEEEDVTSFRERVSIWDIIKLVGLFATFAVFFLYFKYWDFFVNLVSFGDSTLGKSRMIYFTIIFFPFAAMLFLVGLVNVSRTLFVPPKETAVED